MRVYIYGILLALAFVNSVACQEEEDGGGGPSFVFPAPIEIPHGIEGYRKLAQPNIDWSSCPLLPGEEYSARIVVLTAAIKEDPSDNDAINELNALLEPSLAASMKRFLLFKREYTLSMTDADPFERRGFLSRINKALAPLSAIVLPDAVESVGPSLDQPAEKVIRLSTEEFKVIDTFLLASLRLLRNGDEATFPTVWMPSNLTLDPEFLKRGIKIDYFDQKEKWEHLIGSAIDNRDKWRLSLKKGLAFLPVSGDKVGKATLIQLKMRADGNGYEYDFVVISGLEMIDVNGD